MNRNSHSESREKKERHAKKEKAKVKKTTQDCIPIEAVYRDGLFLEEGHIFSRMYSFEDIAFSIKPDAEQENIMKIFEEMLAALPCECTLKIIAVTLKTDVEQRFLEVASQGFNDNLNSFREAYNEVIRSKMTASEVQTSKYIIICVKDDNMEQAEAILSNAEGVLRNMMASLETQITLVSSEERLEILQKIYNQSEKNYTFEHEDGITKFDFKKLAKQGLNFKDVIAPSYLSFGGKSFRINDYYAQSLYISSLPNKLSSRFYTELSSLPFESVVSYYIRPKSPRDAAKVIRNLSVGVQTEIEGSKDKVSKKTHAMSDELEIWAEDIQERDQKMFEFDLSIVHFAPDKDLLKMQEAKIRNSADKHLCSLQPLIMQQERGFVTALPLGIIRSHTARYITTEALALFQPFDEINTFQEGGFYYGINSVNQNVVVINKMRNDNYNSVILGSSGSGKSFTAKQEMAAVILNKPTDSVFILDPEGEYGEMVRQFGGEVIKISPQGNTDKSMGVHINACDLDIDKSLDSSLDPIAMKTDFLCGVLETMIGKGAVLDAEQLSIVTRCISLMYEPYVGHLASLPKTDGKPVTIDREFCPTMQKLFDLLLAQPEPMAQRLAKIMEPFVTGIYSIFAHTTNVDVGNRIICYDISGISEKMTDIALKVCLDDFWNRTISNRRQGRVTHIYADEAHRFFSNPTSASYFEQFWRRLRKWSGVPTAITQNVSDLLISPQAALLLTQSSNIVILKQAEREQMLLAELLSLQPSELSYIKKPKPGCGLIINNGFVIPLTNEFPKENPLYSIFSSKAKSLE